MTPIAVKYKRNSTDEEIPPPSGYMVIHTRSNGKPANEGEIKLINKAFNRAMAQAGELAEQTGQFIEPEWATDGNQIKVLRNDDLPLSIHDVQYFVYLDMLRRKEEMREIEVITISKTTQAIVSKLPVAGMQAWATATQQLEAVISQVESGDDDDVQINAKYYEQVVTLTDTEGVQMLLDAGLITRDDTNDANQYIVPRASAYCTTEWRQE